MRSANLPVFIAAFFIAISAVSAANGIIKTQGTDFVDEDCKPFYFSGYNTWQLLEAAGGACCGGKDSITRQFDEAKENNLNVVRLFAYGTGYNYQLQESPNKYNESALKDLDYIISEASKRDVRLIISLASNWVYGTGSSGTKCWYTNYTMTANDCDDFFTDVNAIQLYKDWVKAITSRKNTITNVLYSDDPTIFAWDLINEGRCDSTDSCSSDDIQSWIETVAPYVKENVKQLVTIGSDGFMQASNCLADKTNPVTNNIGWPLQTGQDFVPNHAVDGIDFASIHLWPDNWLRTDNEFTKNWLSAHSNMSTLLNKPLVLEEFGKAYGGAEPTTGAGSTELDQFNYYTLVYSIVEKSILEGGPLKGVAFWRWGNSDAQSLGQFDNFATIDSISRSFSQVVAPFSKNVVGYVDSASALTCSAAPSTRRMLATTPSSVSIGNSDVPQSFCDAYPDQPASVGK